MNNRFGVKDLFYVLLLLALLGSVLLEVGQSAYQGHQIIALQGDIQRLNDMQLRQLDVLKRIETSLTFMPNRLSRTDVKPGIGGAVAIGVGGKQSTKPLRETLPDGSRYVYYPNPPLSSHNPFNRPDYAQGDWLVQNLGQDPSTLSPYVPQGEMAYIVQAYVLETLLIQSSVTLQWEPWLAQSYRVAKNGLKIWVTLRPNITFSDGVPVTSKDVVFSFNTLMNPKIDDAPMRSSYTDFESCKAINSREVVFTLRHPYFQALANVGALQIIPEHVYKFKHAKEFNNQPPGRLIGSGPYILKSWQRGQQLTLVRNPRYWGPAPTFNRIVYRFIESPQAAMQDYLKGSLDTVSPRAAQYARFTKNAQFVKQNIYYDYHTPSDGYLYICWNLRLPMFHDRATRTALAMLVNRNAIINTFMHGLAVPINGPFSVFSPQNSKHVKPIAYDVALARTLLRKAGWVKNSDGILERAGIPFEFTLTIPTGATTLAQIAGYIQHQYARVGIQVNISPMQFEVMLKRIDSRSFQAYCLAWTGSIEQDPYQIWDSASIADQGSNAGGYSNPKVDKLISEARSNLNTTSRMHQWHQIQAIIYHDQPYLFLFQQYDLMFINHRFRNTKPYGYYGINTGDWYVPLALQKYH